MGNNGPHRRKRVTHTGAKMARSIIDDTDAIRKELEKLEAGQRGSPEPKCSVCQDKGYYMVPDVRAGDPPRAVNCAACAHDRGKVYREAEERYEQSCSAIPGRRKRSDV
jgi:hypothetical protein